MPDELKATTLFEITDEAEEQWIPPPSGTALFLVIVLLTMVGEPLEQQTPPPEPATFAVTMLLEIVNVELEA
jgi:hypothetical protein